MKRILIAVLLCISLAAQSQTPMRVYKEGSFLKICTATNTNCVFYNANVIRIEEYPTYTRIVAGASTYNFTPAQLLNASGTPYGGSVSASTVAVVGEVGTAVATAGGSSTSDATALNQTINNVKLDTANARLLRPLVKLDTANARLLSVTTKQDLSNIKLDTANARLLKPLVKLDTANARLLSVTTKQDLANIKLDTANARLLSVLVEERKQLPQLQEIVNETQNLNKETTQQDINLKLEQIRDNATAGLVKTQITDGTYDLQLKNLPNSKPIPTMIVDGNGDHITSFTSPPIASSFGSTLPSVISYTTNSGIVNTSNVIRILIENHSTTTNASVVYGGRSFTLGFKGNTLGHSNFYEFTAYQDHSNNVYTPYASMVINAAGADVSVIRIFKQ